MSKLTRRAVAAMSAAALAARNRPPKPTAETASRAASEGVTPAVVVAIRDRLAADWRRRNLGLR